MQQSNHRSAYRIAMSLVVIFVVVGGMWLAVVPMGPSSVQVGDTTINPRAVHDPVREGEEDPRPGFASCSAGTPSARCTHRPS